MVNWFFDGLGTMLVGLVIGGGLGGVAGWRIGVVRTRQTQRAGDQAQQTQIGRDAIGRDQTRERRRPE